MTKYLPRGLCRAMTLVAALTLSSALFGLSLQAHAQQAQTAATYPEQALNTDTLRGNFMMPAVARLTNGRFVVMTSVRTSPAAANGTYFQMYGPQGLPVGPFTGVVPTLPGQTTPSIAPAANGFVIVFAFRLALDGPAQVWGVRINASGALIGEPFKINTKDQGHISEQKVAGLKDGGFVVVWSGGPNQSNSGEIYAQRYNYKGGKVGGEFIVNTTRPGSQSMPAVAGLADGGFVVTWGSTASDGDRVYAQRYAANGAMAGVQFKVSGLAGKTEAASAVAGLRGGGFVVAWSRDAIVYARRYTAAGLANGTPFVVGQHANYGAWEPLGLTVLDDDRFLVTWGGSGFVGSVYARVFPPNVGPGGVEFAVNAPAASAQHLHPTAVALSDRNVFVAWEKHVPAKAVQVRLRRLDLPAVP